MFIKLEVKKFENTTKTYVRIVESYRANGKNKHRAIKSYGALEDHEDQDAFLKFVEEELKHFDQYKDQDITITIKAKDNELNASNNVSYNYGYQYLESIYDFLQIDAFLEQISK
jgi:hypothetical protein